MSAHSELFILSWVILVTTAAETGLCVAAAIATGDSMPLTTGAFMLALSLREIFGEDLS